MSDRAFRLILHMAEAVVIEEEIFVEQDEIYTKRFLRDFALEHQFIEEKNITNKLTYLPSIEEIKTRVSEALLKKIHKKLAVKTHPDHCEGDDEEFKKVQGAYENSNAPKLLSLAQQYNVSLSIDPEEIKSMMADIQDRRKGIDSRKNTYRWAWGESDKSEDSKKLVRAGLLIDENAFQEWIAQKEKEEN